MTRRDPAGTCLQPHELSAQSGMRYAMGPSFGRSELVCRNESAQVVGHKGDSSRLAIAAVAARQGLHMLEHQVCGRL
jgi:hypothetical protein